MKSTFEVLLGLGSNQNASENLALGIERLRRDYEVTAVSPWYQSPAMGFSGPDFINLVVVLEFKSDSYPSVGQLVSELKNIEYEFGRPQDAVKYSSRSLDIDLLMFGQHCGEFDGIALPRSDIWQYAFVIRPLLDIRPQKLCPKSGEPIAHYWPSVSAQKLTRLNDT